jgi:cytochrome b561
MVLHWLIAILLITNIGLAWYFNTLHGVAKVPPTQLHKSIGITVLVLSLLRLAWRLMSPPPPLPSDMPRWERLTAGAVYVLFYGVMIGMPLTGWAMVSASKFIHVYPISIFGLFTWPAIAPLTTLAPGPMRHAHHLFLTGHGLLAKLAYVLIVLHVAAALRHQFIRRDDIMARMVPFLRGRTA